MAGVRGQRVLCAPGDPSRALPSQGWDMHSPVTKGPGPGHVGAVLLSLSPGRLDAGPHLPLWTRPISAWPGGGRCELWPCPGKVGVRPDKGLWALGLRLKRQWPPRGPGAQREDAPEMGASVVDGGWEQLWFTVRAAPCSVGSACSVLSPRMLATARTPGRHPRGRVLCKPVPGGWQDSDPATAGPRLWQQAHAPLHPPPPRPQRGLGLKHQGCPVSGAGGPMWGAQPKPLFARGHLILAALRVCAGACPETAENPCKRRRRTGAWGRGGPVRRTGRRRQLEATGLPHPRAVRLPGPRLWGAPGLGGCGDHTASQDPG